MSTFSSSYLKHLGTLEEWEIIAHGFLNRWNFPNSLDALEGNHISSIQAKVDPCSTIIRTILHVALLAVSISTFVDIGAFPN